MIQKNSKSLKIHKLCEKSVLYLFFAVLFFSSCDFTPRIHKDILDAQDSLVKQNFSEAVSKYENILKNNPENKIKVKIYYQLGEIFSLHLGKYKKAIDHFQKVQELTEEPLWQVKSEERIAEICFEFLKNYELSIKSYRKLANFTPRLKDFDKYEYRIARSQFNLKNYEDSAKLFTKLRKNSRHNYHIESFYHLGMIHFEKKEWQKAIDDWKQYIRRESRKDDVVEVKFLMANAYETMEELKKAYNLYYSILGEYPNTEVIENRLNAIYKRRVARKR